MTTRAGKGDVATSQGAPAFRSWRTLRWSRRREHGPADNLIYGFWLQSHKKTHFLGGWRVRDQSTQSSPREVLSGSAHAGH